jgi:hypothetical protein
MNMKFKFKSKIIVPSSLESHRSISLKSMYLFEDYYKIRTLNAY